MLRKYVFEKDFSDIIEDEKLMEDYALQSSECEQKATIAEREVDDMKKAEYMQQYIGHVFDGLISSVNSFGFFVELDNTVEGLEIKEDRVFSVQYHPESAAGPEDSKYLFKKFIDNMIACKEVQ